MPCELLLLLLLLLLATRCFVFLMLECNKICSIVSKGVSLFEMSESKPKLKPSPASNSWWRRALTRIKEFVFQEQRRPTEQQRLFSSRSADLG